MGQAFSQNPFLLFLLVFLPAIFVLHRFYRGPLAPLRRVLAGCGLISIGAFVWINCLNIPYPNFFWHDEVNILAISAAYLHRQPIYHAMGAGYLYSLLYGPSTFLVYTPFLAAFSRPMVAMRVGLCLANLTSLWLLYLVLRHRLSRLASLAPLPIATTLLLGLPAILLGIRGDVWMLLCFASAVVCARRRGWLTAALATGALTGLALDFKFTVAPVVCLVLAILYRRHGWRAVAVSAGASLAVAASLFALPGISLGHYWQWLVLSGHQGFQKTRFLTTLSAAAFLLTAGLAIRFSENSSARRRTWGILTPALFVVALLVSILAGAKDGAGAWHLWPLLPCLLAWLAAEAGDLGLDRALAREIPAGAPGPGTLTRTLTVTAAIAIASTLLTLRYTAHDWIFVHPAGLAGKRAAERAAEDALHALPAQTPVQLRGHNLAMGYGASAANDYRINLRYELPLEGQEYFLDENAIVEATKAGLPIPPGVVARILSCQDVWLIPHGEVPFSTLRKGVLRVADTPYLFPDNIRLSFPRTHTLIQAGPVYDLWNCPLPEQPVLPTPVSFHRDAAAETFQASATSSAKGNQRP